MQLIRPLFFAALAVLLPAGHAGADQDFTIEGRPYRLITTKRPFTEAAADAVTKGGRLVHIDSQAENDAIRAAIVSSVPSGSTAADGGGSVYVWIGGTETTEGTYAWADSLTVPFWTGGKTGSPVNGAYANWGRGTLGSAGPEPDNYNGTQNRTGMALTAWPASGTEKIGQPGEWNDIRDTNQLAYVIEFDGLWASFRMSHGGSPAGTFTAKLFYDKVPLTAGNFVSLAEGTRPFVSEKRAAVEVRPFYNGLKCHRIIAGFMIQGGCPRGDGTSGPGYQFPDEFDTTLRHTAAGMLSMANSGLDTNGSQFFVTVAPTTWLDDKHSIFGQVVDGYATVVQPLSTVATGTGDRPVQDVVIEEIRIHRSGTAARGFAPSLPVADLIPLTASTGADGACMLDFERTPFAGYDILYTGNLKTWTMQLIGEFGAVPDPALLNGTSFAPAGALSQFYRLARITYPSPGPVSLLGKRVVAENATYRLTYDLVSATAATFNITQFSSPGVVSGSVSGPITSWTWTRDSWGGDLSAAIPPGALTIGGKQISFIDTNMRPVTNLSRGALYLPDHNQYYAVPGTSRLTVSALP